MGLPPSRSCDKEVELVELHTCNDDDLWPFGNLAVAAVRRLNQNVLQLSCDAIIIITSDWVKSARGLR
jgi:hypothetical protein